MKVTIVREDKAVHIDNICLFFDFEIDAAIHAVEWDGETGYIEHNDGRQNEPIESLDRFAAIVAEHANLFAIENERQKTEKEEQDKLEADRIAYEQTYTYKRRQEYPSARDQLDMFFHAMDRGDIAKVPEFYDAIKAVKDKYRKS